MDIFEAIILGIIQAITEFLPISSSGHLGVINAFFGQELEDSYQLSITLHLAGALSALVIFSPYIKEMFSSAFSFKWDEASQFMVKMLVANIPLATAGFFFRDYTWFLMGNSSAALLAFIFIINGALLFFAGTKKVSERKNVSFLDAILIGLVQVFALMPGLSRSGATLATALLLGIKKKQALVFSFLMIALPVLISSIIELYRFNASPLEMRQIPIEILVAAFFTAFIVGLAFCRLMVFIVEKSNIKLFAWYNWAFSIMLFVYPFAAPEGSSLLAVEKTPWLPATTYQEQSPELVTEEPKVVVPAKTKVSLPEDLDEEQREYYEYLSTLLNKIADRETPLKEKEEIRQELFKQLTAEDILINVYSDSEEGSMIYKFNKYLDRIRLIGGYELTVIKNEYKEATEGEWKISEMEIVEKSIKK